LLQDRLPDDDENKFVVHGFSIETAKQLWENNRLAILAAWTRDHPGTRPLAWWMFEAPAQPRFKLPENPATWARHPETIPSPTVQSAYLRKHELLAAGEVL
jgi:hypothetical protein